jgi:hypothetical protein
MLFEGVSIYIVIIVSQRFYALFHSSKILCTVSFTLMHIWSQLTHHHFCVCVCVNSGSYRFLQRYIQKKYNMNLVYMEDINLYYD